MQEWLGTDLPLKGGPSGLPENQRFLTPRRTPLHWGSNLTPQPTPTEFKEIPGFEPIPFEKMQPVKAKP